MPIGVQSSVGMKAVLNKTTDLVVQEAKSVKVVDFTVYGITVDISNQRVRACAILKLASESSAPPSRFPSTPSPPRSFSNGSAA